MSVKKIATLLGAVLATIMFANVADADIRVRCETRDDRSRASVKARDLVPGDYQVEIMSGTNTATTDLLASIGDEVEASFDSDADDILSGDDPISSNFIQGGQVTGKILDDGGFVMDSDTVNCRAK